jgi:hypothetical protein
MATIEEVRGKFKNRFDQFKVKTPLRVAYLGDGRGGATSNMVPPGEPDKFWARESIDGDKPFKILNRNPNFTPQFNLPVLLGYPEDDPEQEQVMGIHRALVQFSIGNAGSAIGGVAPHHTKHEWGGGDEVFIDPRMFKPGLIKPTAPTSMKVKILSFQHYYNYWRRYDGGVSPDLAQYKPSADYRYVLLTLDPDTNQLCIRPGNVFTPDLSIDSIISNQATNTFRHIPVPPGNEIPLGVVLLEPGTTKIDWNINGINNMLPMRILLSSPMKEVNERLSLLESATGISSLPSTGAANSVQTDLLPGRIDGNITRLVLNRSSSSATLPTLFVGELAFVNNSPSAIWVGTASGNHAFNVSGGGGATTLGDLTDVNVSVVNDQNLLKYNAATSSWISASAIKIGDNSSGVYFDVGASIVGITAPLRIDNPDGATLLQTDYAIVLDSVAGGNPILFRTPSDDAMTVGGDGGDEPTVVINPNYSPGVKMIGRANDGAQTAKVFEFDSDSGFRFETANSVSALDVRYVDKKIVFNNDTGTSPLLALDMADNKVVFGRSSSAITESIVEFHSASDVRASRIAHFNHRTPGVNRSTSHSYHFKNSSGSMAEYIIHDYATVSTSYSQYVISMASAGIVRNILDIDTSEGEAKINSLGIHDLGFRAGGSSNNTQLFKTDAKLNAVQIGTSVAGQIADFRSHLIEFNKNQNDIDVVFRGISASPTLMYLDAGNGFLGVGTNNPSRILHIVGPDRNVPTFPASLGAKDLLVFENNNNANFAIISGSAHSGGIKFFKNGTALQQGQINYNHSNDNMTFATYGVTKFTLGSGIFFAGATGGDKGTGTINVQGDIYKNNTAYTSPDYALEHWVTGSIDKYKNNDGASGYFRLPIEQSIQYVKEHFRLPRITDEPTGVFGMTNIALEKIEEAHIYIYELHDRIKVLEAKIAQMEKNNE